MNKVIVLIGPSGCGKTTIADELDKTLDFIKAVTDTTRSPRIGNKGGKVERDGIDYNFVTEEYMMEHKEEYIEINHFTKKGWYGSNALRIDRARANADCVICMEINGAKRVKEYYGADTAFIVYVKRERSLLINALEQRLATGEMSADEFDERIKKIDIDLESEFDPVVDFILDNNSTIADSVKQINDFVENDYGRIEPADFNPDITLVDETGSEVSFAILDIIKYFGNDYAVVIPANDDNEDEVEVRVLMIENDESGNPVSAKTVYDSIADEVLEIFFENHSALNLDE